MQGKSRDGQSTCISAQSIMSHKLPWHKPQLVLKNSKNGTCSQNVVIKKEERSEITEIDQITVGVLARSSMQKPKRHDSCHPGGSMLTLVFGVLNMVLAVPR